MAAVLGDGECRVLVLSMTTAPSHRLGAVRYVFFALGEDYIMS